MKIFAIDLSSKYGSIAVIDNGEIAAERRWEENYKNRQQLFDAIADIDIDWNSIDCFAAGRGPGAFSGMRIGFTVINSLAAPNAKPVYALNSGAAIAAQIGAEKLAVIGDARRNKVWVGIFSGTQLEKEFRLIDRDELLHDLPAGSLVTSPDADRLADLLADYETPEGGKPVYPSAGILGQLVHERLEKGVESEPFEPLYMHPPVFIAPRFPA